jgi:hypothetical protein
MPTLGAGMGAKQPGGSKWAASGMAAFETKIVKSCRSLAMDPADLCRPVSLLTSGRDAPGAEMGGYPRAGHPERREVDVFSRRVLAHWNVPVGGCRGVNRESGESPKPLK